MSNLKYRIGYLEGQAGAVNAILAGLDDTMDLLIDQLSLFKKGKAHASVRIWEGKIQQVEEIRERLEQSHAMILKQAKFVSRIPIARKNKSHA